MACWAPLIIPTDGLDYLNSAYTLAHGGGFQDFVPYKAPGLTVVLAACMGATSHWAALLHWLHAALLTATAAITWLTARRVLGQGNLARVLAAGSAVVVGVHPVLLTYQSYLLRECAGTLLVPLAAWLIVRHAQVQPTGARALVRVLLLGVVCGVGALYRENFQTILLLGPLLLGWAAVRNPHARPRAAIRALGAAALAAAVSMATMAPWLFWMHRHYHCWSVTTPKTQFNRAINAWSNGLIDGTELPGLTRGSSDYNYIAQAVLLKGIVERAPDEAMVDVVIDALTHKPEETSDLCAGLVRTAMSRNPTHAARDMGVAALSLSGLRPPNHPAANANAWLALPLRGLAPPGSTNYNFNVESILAHSRFTPRRARFDPTLAQSRVGLDGVTGSRGSAVFDACFTASERARPVLAILFLLGCMAAALRRSVEAGALAILVLANVLGAAVLMMTAVDRFAAPMIPLMVLVAVYGIQSLCDWGKKKAGVAPATPA